MSDHHDPVGRMLQDGEWLQIEPADPALYGRSSVFGPAQQHFATILSQFLAATIHRLGPPANDAEWDRWVHQCASMTQSVIRRAAAEPRESTVLPPTNRSL